MIPTGGQALNQAAGTSMQPSLTYRLDLATGRIRGLTSGLEAVKQAVLKIILTERYDYLAYTFGYGIEIKGLVGKSPAFIRSELTRRLQEALFQDERIEAIQNVSFTQSGDTMNVTFTVISSEGNFEQEVNVDV